MNLMNESDNPFFISIKWKNKKVKSLILYNKRHQTFDVQRKFNVSFTSFILDVTRVCAAIFRFIVLKLFAIELRPQKILKDFRCNKKTI